jgi:hypothetical protein
MKITEDRLKIQITFTAYESRLIMAARKILFRCPAEYLPPRVERRLISQTNRQNYPKWAAAAKPFFLALYGKEFQDHKVFEELKASAESIARKRQKKLRGIFQNLIWTGIKNGFKSIALKPPLVN